MRVLHFTNKPIYPVIDGGCLAMKSISKLLENQTEIEPYHFTLSTHKHPFDSKAYSASKYKKVHEEWVNTKTNPITFFSNLICGKSYNISRFYSKSIEQKLKQFILTNKIESVIVESIYLSPYFDVFHDLNVTIYLRTHNIEHHIWKQKAETQKFGLKKWGLKTLSDQLKKEEVKAWKNVAGVLAITTDDANYIKNYQQNTLHLNTTVEINKETTNYTLNDFYFLGAYDWAPNKEGLDWLIKEVLHKRNFTSKLHIAGKNLPKNLYSEYDFVKNHGEIDKASEFISAHGICVIPLKSGGGIKMKALESFSHGKPVISTPEGARGLQSISGKELHIAKNADEFYSAMCTFQESEEKRKSVGDNGKQYLIDNFALESEQKKLIEFLSK
ncbi:MAG: glycosyltransferase family 4 protein [Lishizhenia sp.]